MGQHLRHLDLGRVSGLRSQTIWHAVAETMAPGDDPVLAFETPGDAYVSIGYHRRIEEVDVAACRRRGLPVYRRRAGGGPVLCDEHQLFFQLIAPAGALPAMMDQAWRRAMSPAVTAFRALGVAGAALEPGNDIASGPWKLSGTGAARIGDALVFVGNVIFEFDHDAAADILAVPDEAKGEAASLMRRHLAPIRDLAGCEVGRDEAAAVLRDAYEEAFGTARTDRLSAAEERAAARLDAVFPSRAWVAAERPPQPPRVKIRSGVALLAVGPSWFVVSGGRIERAAVRDGWARSAGEAERMERALAGVTVAEAPGALAAFDRGPDLAAAIADACKGGC